MTNEEGKFTILNEEGKEIECEVLFTFESDETHKDYIVYTDNSFDADGNTRVFASVYDPKGIDPKLKPLETEKEWKIIEIVLSELQSEIDREPEEGAKAPMACEDFIQMIKDKKVNGAGELDGRVLYEAADRLETETDLGHIDELFKILSENGFSEHAKYSSMGMEAYAHGNFAVAETAFRRAMEYCGDDMLRMGYANNLAYLIRRKEIRNPENAFSKEIVDLLRLGVAKKDTFSLINMALFWALNVGSQEDWRMADQLFAFVKKADVHSACLWWFELGRKGDIEGYLVHLLLLRNGKIKQSPLGDIHVLFAKAKAEYAAMPENFGNMAAPFDGDSTDAPISLDDSGAV